MLSQRRLREAIELHQAGQLEAASQKYAELLSQSPNDPGLWNLQGVVAGQMGSLNDSIRCLNQAIALNPGEPEYYRNLAITFSQTGDAVEEARVNNDWGNALQDRYLYAESLPAYDRVLELNPNESNALNNKAAALNHMGRYQEALVCLKRTLEILEGEKEFLPAHLNSGVSYWGLGNIDQALLCYRRALQIDPNSAIAHWGLAFMLLLKGQLQEGFREYEWRWKWEGYKVPRRNFPQPVWKGEPPEDLRRPLLVISEQGFGDAIQFARYIPMLAWKGYKVLFEVRPELYTLFSEGFGYPQITVIPRQDSPDQIYEDLPFSAYTGIMSLPLRFETSLETVPGETPYLTVPAHKVDRWRIHLSAPKDHLKIGVAWAGNPGNLDDFKRSIPPDIFETLLHRRDVTFYSLQKGEGAAWEFSGGNLIKLSDQIKDFSDTAAIMENLDLVITVCTSVAHLAGALNRPTWIMLPKVADWRWMIEGDTSPWYPSARLFRQPEAGDWASVIRAVGYALDNLVNERSHA